MVEPPKKGRQVYDVAYIDCRYPFLCTIYQHVVLHSVQRMEIKKLHNIHIGFRLPDWEGGVLSSEEQRLLRFCGARS